MNALGQSNPKASIRAISLHCLRRVLTAAPLERVRNYTPLVIGCEGSFSPLPTRNMLPLRPECSRTAYIRCPKRSLPPRWSPRLRDDRRQRGRERAGPGVRGARRRDLLARGLCPRRPWRGPRAQARASELPSLVEPEGDRRGGAEEHRGERHHRRAPQRGALRGP